MPLQKLSLSHAGVLLLLFSLAVEAPTEASIGMTHLLSLKRRLVIQMSSTSSYSSRLSRWLAMRCARS
jgi:hypothetical protein